MDDTERKEDAAEMKEAEEKRITEQKEKEEAHKVAEDFLKAATSGTMELAVPFKDGDRIIEKLDYDFQKLSGEDYAEIMDEAGESKGNLMGIGRRQALDLFCATAAKCNEGLFPKEIRKALNIRDAIQAVRIAQVFFGLSLRARDYLITKT